MNLISETSVDKILDAAWRGYRNAHAAVTALESIGLSPDGAIKNPGGRPTMASLFAVQTACEDAIFEILGIPRGTDAADKASGILSEAVRHGKPDEKFQHGTRAALASLLGDDPEPDPDSRDEPYEVTMSITGGLTIYAESCAAAMATANAMSTDEILRSACWNYPAATDAYEG